MAKRKKNDQLIYPILSNVASGNETTGMIPAPPVTQDEYDSLRMMSSMELPETDAGGVTPQTPDGHGD